jgi:ribonuclease T1
MNTPKPKTTLLSLLVLLVLVAGALAASALVDALPNRTPALPSAGSGSASTGSGSASAGSGSASTGSGSASTGSGSASTGSGSASAGSSNASTAVAGIADPGYSDPGQGNPGFNAETTSPGGAAVTSGALAAKTRKPRTLKTISIDQLPPEARQTLDAIEQGPPYPYDRDGITFHNYEKLLPVKKDGYYQEFTVKTPGENGRGARRIIRGANGELYYTADHYRSFLEIIP